MPKKNEPIASKTESDKAPENRERAASLLSNSNKKQEVKYAELKRIKQLMTKESEKIKYVKRKENQPFIFNDLYPYFNVNDLESTITSPESLHNCEYHTRFTATGIIEPWVAHRMEKSLLIAAAPASASAASTASSSGASTSRMHKIKTKSKNKNNEDEERSDSLERPKREQLAGSTLAPNFPKVIIKKPKKLIGPFYVDDINAIRKEFKKNMENKTRFEEDRNRTINDFYRMNLDRVNDNKEKMSEVYRAYLENTPGSKKALEELLNKKQQFSHEEQQQSAKHNEVNSD